MTGRRSVRDSGRARRDRQAPSNLDAGVLFQIKQHLVKRFHIPSKHVLIEHTISITDTGCDTLGRLNHFDIAFVRGLKHTPDIIVKDGNDRLVFIIEQDGRSHSSEKQMKKDSKRNKHYDRAGILYIVMNTKNITMMGLTPLRYLDEELQILSSLHLLRLPNT